MNKIISCLTQEPKAVKAYWKYGFLVFVTALFVASVELTISETKRVDYLFNPTYVPLMLVLNHLAFQFQLTLNMRVILRSMAILWLGFVLIGLLVHSVRG